MTVILPAHQFLDSLGIQYKRLSFSPSTEKGAAHVAEALGFNERQMVKTLIFETDTPEYALVMVGAFKADPIGDIGKALALPSLRGDARFATHALQVENKAALHAIFRERFAGNSTAYWISRLEEQDLLCSPVRSLAEALADEQTAINGMLLECDGHFERVRVVGSPIHLEEAEVSIRIPPATLGQHTAEVLAEIAAPPMKAAS